ncbi:MAG: choice-of-anchor D domain-containing protein [Myxococcota bacterium]
MGGLLAFAAGCQEYGVQDAPDGGFAGPEIEVTPTSITFGPTAGPVSDTFTVKNTGSSTLHTSEIRLDVGEGAFTLLEVGPFDVEPAEEHQVEITYTPAGALTYGQVTVLSDDADEPEVPVQLEGLGETPALEIHPPDHIFGTLCADSVVLTLENVGVADLVITALDYRTAFPDLVLTSDLALPLTLGPSESAPVTVDYLPVSGVPVSGELSVTSNDPRGERIATQSSELSPEGTSETFVVEADPAIDILFAIDKSGSMVDDARNLGNAFADFITEVDLVTNDWQIGVVTKDAGCFNNGILSPVVPNYEAEFDDAVSGLGLTSGDLTEALLALTDEALQETSAGGCNFGFLRPGAVLHVVLVSDEPEQSGQPADYWIDRWQAEMSDPNLLVVSAVADAFSGCEDGASGYVEAATLTGGLLLDICNANWGTFAAQLGGASAQSLLTFLLGATPDPGTISVAVDGTTYPNGWHYDPIRNAVVIDVELPEGAVVEITYVALGCE